MREIKFRAWDESQKVMHNEFQFVKSGNDGNDWILFTSHKQPISDYEVWTKNPYFAQQLKIMQFTGLLDKNGKEIYEGDIIRDGLSPSVVEFKSHTNTSYGHGDSNTTQYLGYAFHFWASGLGAVEVIGNVHENPELIKP